MKPKDFILKSVNDAHDAEKVLLPASNMLNRHTTSGNKTTPSMCREFIEESAELARKIEKYRSRVQKDFDDLEIKKAKFNPEVKSGFTTMAQGLKKLSQASQQMCQAVLKSIDLIKLDLSVKEPSKSKRDSLKKEIHNYKEKALKLLHEGKKLILAGAKITAENAVENAKKLPSKISMAFSKITGHKKPKINPAVEKPHRYRRGEI